jgi:mono/diheme cytochrome c family protein
MVHQRPAIQGGCCHAGVAAIAMANVVPANHPLKHEGSMHMRKPGIVAMAVAFCCALAMSNSGTLSAADLSAAHDNFDGQCAKCHGESGRGDGSAGMSLPVRPRNFTDCSRMSKESDERIFNTIKGGGDSVGLSKEMPPWNEAFDDDEIKGLVAYVRQFCNSQRATSR